MTRAFVLMVLATASCPSGSAPGSAPLTIRLLDSAGLEGRDTSAVLVLDFTPPAVAAHSVRPEVAGIGARIECALEVPEELAAPPVLVAAAERGQMRLDVVGRDGASYLFAHLVAPGDPEGEHVLSAVLEDLAGNTRSVALGAGLERPPAAHRALRGPGSGWGRLRRR